MKLTLNNMSVDQLVDHFAAIALAQHKAIDDNPQFARLYRKMDAVDTELKNREGDQRRALLRLYDHSNIQVRLAAAKATLAVAPDAARQMLQTIADSGWFPQAGDAGMSLWNLDRGVFKPQ